VLSDFTHLNGSTDTNNMLERLGFVHTTRNHATDVLNWIESSLDGFDMDRAHQLSFEESGGQNQNGCYDPKQMDNAYAPIINRFVLLPDWQMTAHI
jgi:hypothetical protein